MDEGGVGTRDRRWKGAGGERAELNAEKWKEIEGQR